MANPNQPMQENIQELLEILMSFQNIEECRNFMCDLCTAQELLIFAQRIQVAKRLMAGDTYSAIRSQFPVSSPTITRVSTSLHYGTGGYRSVLGRFMQAKENGGDSLNESAQVTKSP